MKITRQNWVDVMHNSFKLWSEQERAFLFSLAAHAVCTIDAHQGSRKADEIVAEAFRCIATREERNALEAREVR